MNAATDEVREARGLHRASGWLARVENFFTDISGLAIFLLMGLTMCEVIGRRVFNSPIPGTIDIIEASMATFAVLGAAACQREGGHVRMDLLVSNLEGRMKWILEFIAIGIAFGYIVVITRQSFNHFLRSWNIGDSTIDIQLPLWPSKLIVPIALSILAIRLGFQLVGYVRLIINPNAQPVAVPLPKTTHEKAQDEIREILGDDAVTPGPDTPDADKRDGGSGPGDAGPR